MGGKRKRRWLVRLGLSTAAALVLALAIGTCVGCAWRREFYRGGTSAPQDPVTGVMEGAEEIRIEGANPRACLLVHGWLTSPTDFGDLPRALAADGWDVYAPHQYGHCTHPRDMRDLTADKMLEAIRDDYADLRARYDHVALVGFSAGGAVLALLAAEHPPDRLVLVAPFLGVRYKWYYILPPRWWQGVVAPVMPYVGRKHTSIHINRKEGLKRLRSYTVFPTRANDGPIELRRRLREDVDVARLSMPVLLVYAPGDDVCSPKAELDFFRRLPGEANQVLACPRSNHHILNDFDRDGAVRTIVGFLGGQ